MTGPLPPVPGNVEFLDASPDHLPAGAPQCARCLYMVWEGPLFVANPWHVMHCGKWREELPGGIQGRAERACWWERYGGIGRCGPAGEYFAPKK